MNKKLTIKSFLSGPVDHHADETAQGSITWRVVLKGNEKWRRHGANMIDEHSRDKNRMIGDTTLDWKSDDKKTE
ncbi:hypothetical protein GCK72_024815 [Caenorhabditis remanei]|uniref:Uncharacterized protein n=1 Tax=Caenorhabditis remanei TaxID=31234 RepID=A0A2P4WRI6_CAERE|nr:hypothetical protein GCK72_024815 [Caenorhabditis remanei]KAF1748348.1 hypothetical protein GCK72_024815 [Caenorhabditis remanei]